ncbi:MAG: hypothetical protein H0U07_09980, partial [Actinobacteria bacterium]|nr:hypothetical protein [Actinomycetota bacterium]
MTNVGATESPRSAGTGGAGAGAGTETEIVRGIRDEYAYGFSNSDEAENYFFK